MATPDANKIVRAYLLTQPVSTLVGNRVYTLRAPDDSSVPNVTLMVRGGSANPYIPEMPGPSFQIDCWSTSPIDARKIYLSMYDSLQGLQNQSVVIGANTYHIASAIEEVHGQDLEDVDIPGRFRVLSFWKILVK
jgi:hypothetical protein